MRASRERFSEPWLCSAAYSERSVAEASLVISASRGADASAPRDAGAGVSLSGISFVAGGQFAAHPRTARTRNPWRMATAPRTDPHAPRSRLPPVVARCVFEIDDFDQRIRGINGGAIAEVTVRPSLG